MYFMLYALLNLQFNPVVHGVQESEARGKIEEVLLRRINPAYVLRIAAFKQVQTVNIMDAAL